MEDSWKEQQASKLQHKLGTTRRELLSHGFYSFASCLAMPSLLTVLARATSVSAQAVRNDDAIPFICFDMAGGAALAGNALVGKAGGPDDLLRSYSTLGWDPRSSSASIDRRFGLPMAGDVSGLFTGMVTNMSPEAQRGLRLGSVCHFSRLDTGDNPQNAAGLAVALGSRGYAFANGLKSTRTISGGRSRSVLDGTSFSPTYVSDVTELQATLIFGGQPLANMGADQLRRLMTATRDLTEEQMTGFQGESGARLLRERVEGFLNEPDLGSIGVDPRGNPTAQDVWGITPSSNSRSSSVVQATISANVIDGISGPGVWTLGGCDYHDQTSTSGDQKDTAMGEAIGRAVEYAHRRGKPLFFQLITDGSCSAVPGTRIWTGDTNEGMQIFGYYKPDGAPEYARNNMQIGHFNDAQAAERSTLVGADPKLATLAVFANYCNIQGKMEEFSRLTRAFDPAQLATLLVFGEG